MKVVQVTVPDNAEPGDVLTLYVEGQELDLPLPTGAKPGDVLQLKVQVRDKNDCDAHTNNYSDLNDQKQNSDRENIEIIEYEIKLKNKEPIRLESSSNNSVDSQLWPAGQILTRWIANQSSFPEKLSQSSNCNVEKLTFNGKTVIELGAGLGSAGIAASYSGAANVFLTDIPSAMDQIKHNIELNRAFLDIVNPRGKLKAVPLEWGKIDTTKPFAKIDQSIDILVLGDVLYDCLKGYDHLIDVIDRLASEDTIIIMAVRWRKPLLERKFFKDMESYDYRWTLLTYDELPCTLDWNEYGDPECEKSNIYLSQAVKVKDADVPLYQVSEEDLNRMTDEEHHVYESRQIQIYMGSKSISAKKKKQVRING